MSTKQEQTHRSWALRLGVAWLVVAGLLAGGSVFAHTWVVEVRGEDRAVLGPWSLTLCDGEGCRTERYSSRLARMEQQIRSPRGGAVERERWRSGVSLMRYDRKKGLQIAVPALVAGGGFLLAALLAWLGRGRRRWRFLRSSATLLAGLGAAVLVTAALVFADGMSHFPATGTVVRWGRGLWLALGGAGAGLVGGLLVVGGVSDRKSD